MKQLDFSHVASDSKRIYVYRWLPEASPRAVLVVSHGLGEHAARYARLAESLTASGWAVYAPDHRGHGKTASEGELGWFAEKNGFRRVVDDLHEVILAAKAERPGLPVFLFGHSMGSVIAEYYLGLHGAADVVSGCALSGLVDPPSAGLLAVARLLAGLGCFFKGQKSKAPLLDSMSFSAYNKAIEHPRTRFDWLSRDAVEVDKYVADPLCGFVATDGLYRDFLAGFDELYGKGGLIESLPKDLPLLIMTGEFDPCGGVRGFPQALAAKLRAKGLSDLSLKIYPGARHEVLNETNRADVTRDLSSWLESKLGPRGGRA